MAVQEAGHRRVARESRPRGGRSTASSARAIASQGGCPRGHRDDEASIRDSLSKTSPWLEHDVDLAPDGRTAVERLRIIPHDLLITDPRCQAWMDCR